MGVFNLGTASEYKFLLFWLFFFFIWLALAFVYFELNLKLRQRHFLDFIGIYLGEIVSHENVFFLNICG